MTDRPVSLASHLNATAATWNDDRAAGFVNAWGNSFPAEELPFGKTRVVGGRVFRLARKAPGAADHLEVLSQCLRAAGRYPATGIAALCFGEMGSRRWDIRVEGPDGSEVVSLTAPHWVVGPDAAGLGDHLVASHLHYVGGYELDHLRPVVWRVEATFERPRRVTGLLLSESPLVHVLALSLLEDYP